MCCFHFCHLKKNIKQCANTCPSMTNHALLSSYQEAWRSVLLQWHLPCFQNWVYWSRKYQYVRFISAVAPDSGMIHQCSLLNSNHLKWAVNNNHLKRASIVSDTTQPWIDCKLLFSHYAQASLGLLISLKHLIRSLPMSWNFSAQDTSQLNILLRGFSLEFMQITIIQRVL